MNTQFKAIGEVHRFFTGEGIPYVLIGGIALQWWGEPRFTRDVDVTILVDPREEEKVLAKILAAFSPRIPEALAFALKNRICLVRSREGYEIDISLGVREYEEDVMKRAFEFRLDRRHVVRICSAEDLVIHKAVAGRPQDVADIEGVILRQGKRLDTRYIRRWLREFSEALNLTEVLDRFEKPWKRLMRRRK